MGPTWDAAAQRGAQRRSHDPRVRGQQRARSHRSISLHAGVPAVALRMRRFELAAYALLIAITAVRIGSTWRVFSQTIDEPVSLLAGYLWLSGKPSINPEHPPLPRILEAFPLWRAGVQDGEEP